MNLESAFGVLLDAVRQVVREEVRAVVGELLAGGRAGELTTCADFARSLGIGVSTVRVAIREQRLDVTRVGRAIRIHAGATIRPRSAARADANANAAMSSAARRLGIVR